MGQIGSSSYRTERHCINGGTHNRRMEQLLGGGYASMCPTPIIEGRNGVGFIACCKPHSIVIESYSTKEEALAKARYYKDSNFEAALNAYKACLEMAGRPLTENCNSGNLACYTKDQVPHFSSPMGCVSIKGENEKREKHNKGVNACCTSSASATNEEGIVFDSISSDIEMPTLRAENENEINNKSDIIPLEKQHSGSSTTIYSSNKSSRLQSADSINVLMAAQNENPLGCTDTSICCCPKNNKLKASSLPQYTSVSSNFILKDADSDHFQASICDEIAQLCFCNGRPDEALKWYSKALSFDKNNPLYMYRRGVVLQSEGYIELAIASFNEALRHDPLCKPAIFNLAVVKRDHEPEEALDLFTQLLMLEPNNTEVMSLMAQCHENQGRLTEAISYLTKVLELDTNNYGVKRSLQKIKARVSAAR